MAVSADKVRTCADPFGSSIQRALKEDNVACEGCLKKAFAASPVAEARGIPQILLNIRAPPYTKSVLEVAVL